MAETAATPPVVMEVGLVCDAGTSHTGIHGLTDLFGYAGRFASKHRHGGLPASVRIVHWRVDERSGEIRCSSDSHPGRPHAPSVLVIPGNEEAPHPRAEECRLAGWLRSQHRNGVVLAAVCGGVFILARTGLLDGRQATTHWAFNEQFAAQFPQVLTETDHMVIDYGDVMTGGGVLAWADLGLRVTERFLGPTVMLETARYMLVDPPRREQRFYSDVDPRTKHGDAAILAIQQLLASQREHRLHIADLARRACMEQRTFLRRFLRATGMLPSEYQQRLRISRARELLEFSGDSVDQIAARIGYEDAAGFRRVFRKFVGLNPSDYRKRFAPGAA